VYYENRENEKALKCLKKSIQLCPYHVRAFHNRALVWEEMGEWAKATDDYTRIIEINPNIWEVYAVRGWCYCNQGEFDKALADYRTSVIHAQTYR